MRASTRSTGAPRRTWSASAGKLAEELHGWDDPDAREWSRNLRPLAEAIAARYVEYFPKQTYPIRSGVHPNTAFGFSFAHDYARAVGDDRLRKLVEERARSYFGRDADAPARWEPDGADFLSPSLAEADLMRRVLPVDEFRAWFAKFLPGAAKAEPRSLFTPATVTDRADLQLVHLDGLNLSRAWCLRGVAAALPAGDPARKALAESADRHAGSAVGQRRGCPAGRRRVTGRIRRSGYGPRSPGVPLGSRAPGPALRPGGGQLRALFSFSSRCFSSSRHLATCLRSTSLSWWFPELSHTSSAVRVRWLPIAWRVVAALQEIVGSLSDSRATIGGVSRSLPICPRSRTAKTRTPLSRPAAGSGPAPRGHRW